MPIKDPITICVITTSRADYGLLRPVLKLLEGSPNFHLQLVVTGSHLLSSYGLTINEIYEDNIPIHYECPIFEENMTSSQHATIIGEGTKAFEKYFRETNPDCILVLGDRFELMSIVLPAFLQGIPIAHMCGGDLTFGAIDESIRHAITKLASLHFVTNEDSERRVIQMGEPRDRVFNVGHTAIDNIRDLPLISKEVLESEFGVSFQDRNILLTYHPVTHSNDFGEQHLQNIFTVLQGLKNTSIFITGNNVDKGFEAIDKRIKNFVNCHDNVWFFGSLGTQKYFSFIAQVDLVIGNSSSGLMEVPYFKIPTIDVGDREEGRVRGNSVIHCDGEVESIRNALDLAFHFEAKDIYNPYGYGHAAQKLVEILSKIATLRMSLKKKFVDLKYAV